MSRIAALLHVAGLHAVADAFGSGPGEWALAEWWRFGARRAVQHLIAHPLAGRRQLPARAASPAFALPAGFEVRTLADGRWACRRSFETTAGA